MKRLKDKHGFSVLEAIASVAIITLVFTTALVTIVAMRNQTIATENKRIAIEVASSMKEDLNQSLTYQTLFTWLGNTTKEIDSISCSTLDSPVSCQIFNDNQNDTIPQENIVITFFEPTPSAISFKMINFSITIAYYNTRSITIEGVIYE